MRPLPTRRKGPHCGKSTIFSPAAASYKDARCFPACRPGAGVSRRRICRRGLSAGYGREGGVFRQQAAVGVGREDIVEPRAFAAVLAIVAIARQDAAHGAHAAAKIGLPGVVFKADDRLPGRSSQVNM